VWGRSALGIEARRSGGEAVGGWDAEAPFYRVGGGAGRSGDEGEWAAAVVRHDGGGGNHFRRGSARAVMGSEEGGARRQHACTDVRRRWRRRPFGPGRKTTGRGPACR
jgi:hypothetical protein